MSERNFFQTIPERLKVNLSRVMNLNLQMVRSTDAESRIMSSAGMVSSVVARKFALWRKAMLWTAAVTLFLNGIIHLVKFETAEDQIRKQTAAGAELQMEQMEQMYPPNGVPPAETLVQNFGFSWADAQEADYFDVRRAVAQAQADNTISTIGTDNLDIMTGLSAMLLLTVFAATVFVVLAAVFWTKGKLTRIFSAIAFAAIFFSPFLLALIPFSKIMDFDHVQGGLKMRENVEQIVGVSMAVIMMQYVLPRAIALFSGVIRSSMSVKTLIPESALPGWTAIILGPLYSVFLLLVLGFVNQVYPDVKLLFGVLFLCIAPLMFLLRFRSVVRPQEDSHVGENVGSVRTLSAVFTSAGVFLIAMFLMDIDQFRAVDAINLIFAVIGSVVLMTVVGADVNLKLLQAVHAESDEKYTEEMRISLHRKLGELRAGTENSPQPPPLVVEEGQPATE